MLLFCNAKNETSKNIYNHIKEKNVLKRVIHHQINSKAIEIGQRNKEISKKIHCVDNIHRKPYMAH